MSVVGVELRPTAPCQSRTRDGYRLFITRPLCEHILDYSTLWLAAASRMLVIGTSRQLTTVINFEALRPQLSGALPPEARG